MHAVNLAAVALVLAGVLPAGVQAEGWEIDGETTGPVTNTGSLDFLRIINGSVIDGDVTNTSTGEIASVGFGIQVVDSEIRGTVRNAGRVTASVEGISLDDSEINDGIINSGSINANQGIYVGPRIPGEQVGSFDGGILNSGSIDAKFVGIEVRSFGNFDGGVVNSGLITVGDRGTDVLKVTNFNGDIFNSGNITTGRHGIFVRAPVRGGIWNKGTIRGGESAVYVEDDLRTPTVINLMGGAISGDIVLSGTESDTVNISGGLLDGTIDGTKGPRDDRVNFLLNDNSIVFDGDILGVGHVLVDPGNLILNGSITDTGAVEVDAATRLVLGEASQVNTATYKQDTGATLGFATNPSGTHGQLTADSVDLAGNLQILAPAGSLYPDSLSFSNLVNWTTRTGTFNPIASESLFLAYRQNYGPNSLSVSQERVPFSAYGQTRNQHALGAALERGYAYPAPNSEAVGFYAPLFDIRSSGDYVEFLDAVSGSTHANALQATMYTSQAVNQAVQHRTGPMAP